MARAEAHNNPTRILDFKFRAWGLVILDSRNYSGIRASPPKAKSPSVCGLSGHLKPLHPIFFVTVPEDFCMKHDAKRLDSGHEA